MAGETVPSGGGMRREAGPACSNPSLIQVVLPPYFWVDTPGVSSMLSGNAQNSASAGGWGSLLCQGPLWPVSGEL